MSTKLENDACTCGGRMVLRNGSKGAFYGCNRFPHCRRTVNIPEYNTGNAIHTDRPTTTLKDANPVVGSPEQQAIWDAIRNGTSHVVVKALAGTGKSFTCRHAMKLVPPSKKILYLAFNREIVKEFSQGAPDNADVRTLNGMGFRIVKSVYPDAIIDDEKIDNIIAELHRFGEPNRALVQAVKQLVSLAQGYLMLGRNEESLLEVAARHEVELDDDIRSDALKLVPAVLEISQARPTVVSFNDQLWLPVILNMPTPKYDLIFVDEAQDLNKVQHALVLKLLAPHGRVVVVGDDHQAIYGFRGSDVNSIANFCTVLEKTGTPIETFPLTVTRRCCKAVVAEAQSLIPAISALPDAIEGEVVDATEETAQYQPGDMVVCRTNAPLASVAFRLLKKGIKAVIRGRDIGSGLVSLIKRQKAINVNDLIAKLEQWMEREHCRIAGTKQEASITQANRDRYECIVALSEDCETITELCARISSLFDNFDANGMPNRAVICSSIHRSKGLEAQRVFWLRPGLSVKATQPWQQVQETNLRYVAITRAKETLVYVR